MNASFQIIACQYFLKVISHFLVYDVSSVDDLQGKQVARIAHRYCNERWEHEL
jgi:hypothetical protein